MARPIRGAVPVRRVRIGRKERRILGLLLARRGGTGFRAARAVHGPEAWFYRRPGDRRLCESAGLSARTILASRLWELLVGAVSAD